MSHRWISFSVGAAVLLGCSDAPTSPHRAPDVPLTPLQYALQLRGDPFLSNVAGLLGQQDQANRIDDALLALNQSPGRTAPLLASAQASLVSALNEEVDTPVGETDIFSAVVTLTLDRIAQIDSLSSAPASDPPPVP